MRFRQWLFVRSIQGAPCGNRKSKRIEGLRQARQALPYKNSCGSGFFCDRRYGFVG